MGETREIRENFEGNLRDMGHLWFIFIFFPKTLHVVNTDEPLEALQTVATEVEVEERDLQ